MCSFCFISSVLRFLLGDLRLGVSDLRLGVGGLSNTGQGLSNTVFESFSSNPESTLGTESGVMTLRSRGSRSGSGVLTFLSRASRSFFGGFRLCDEEPGLKFTSVSSPLSSDFLDFGFGGGVIFEGKVQFLEVER